MSTYELPDGFEGMETCPYTDDKEVFINVLYINGRINPIEQWRIHNTPNRDRIGWSPIVPPKKKRRFVVVKGDRYGPYRVKDTTSASTRDIVVNFMPNVDIAQSVADLLETKLNGVTP